MRPLKTTIAAIFGSILVMLLFTNEAEALDIDLEPVNFTFSPDYPIRGEGLEIYFEVVNHGAEPAQDVKIVVWNGTSECDVGDECMPIYETTEAVIGNERIAVIDITCNPDICGGYGDRVPGYGQSLARKLGLQHVFEAALEGSEVHDYVGHRRGKRYRAGDDGGAGDGGAH